MPRLTVPLTPATCDSLKPAAGKQVARKSDGAVAGLQLEAKIVKCTNGSGKIRETVSRWWRWRYRVGGKDTTITLGQYPTLTLAGAREKARELQAEYLADPTLEAYRQRQSKPVDLTFGQWFEQWLTDPMSGISRKGGRQPLNRAAVQQVRSAYARILGPVSDTRLAELTQAQIRPLIEAYSSEAPTLARRLYQYVSRSLLEAVPDHIEDTPLRGAAFKMAARKPRPHKVADNLDEIRTAVLNGTSGESVKGAYRLQWWTLCRPGEAAGARWDEFDLDAATWTIPASRMKMEEEVTRPLPRQAVVFLRSLDRRSQWLFPSERRDGPINPNSISIAVCNAGLQGQHTPHAVRHTGATWLNNQTVIVGQRPDGSDEYSPRFHPDWIEAQLAHAVGGVRGLYNRAKWLEPRRAMMQVWADHLDTATTGNEQQPEQAENLDRVLM